MSRALLDEAVLKYVDAKLAVAGQIKTNDVAEAFGLGRQKISRIFTEYRTVFPANMHHDVNAKCYVRGEKFKTHYLGKTLPDDYIAAVAVVFAPIG